MEATYAERQAEREAAENQKLKVHRETFPQDPDTAHRLWIGTHSGSVVKVDCPGPKHCKLWLNPELGDREGVGQCGFQMTADDVGSEFLEWQIGPAYYPPHQPFPIGVLIHGYGGEDEFPEFEWWPIAEATQ